MIERQNSLFVSKFGGSSMADIDSIRRVIQIIESDPRRRVIVVSAPGRNTEFLTKVTDDLLNRNFDRVYDRFQRLADGLNWQQGSERIAEVREQLSRNDGFDFRLSRGEYLTARLMADLIGGSFVDSRQLIVVRGDRTVDPVSDQKIRERLENFEGRIIVPGFYGANRRGWIRTFPRDGSDITGAILARALDASLYEIFSDTNGIYDQDPRLNSSARNFSHISFAEMEILSQTAKIVQSQAISILRDTGISINCRNTFSPDHPGTTIS